MMIWKMGFGLLTLLSLILVATLGPSIVAAVWAKPDNASNISQIRNLSDPCAASVSPQRKMDGSTNELTNPADMQTDSNDPALLLPGIAELAKQYPRDWEQQVHPRVLTAVKLQRLVGRHGIVVGYSDQEPNPQYPNPKFRIIVEKWDGVDLFSTGLPRVYNQKPVELELYRDGWNVRLGLFRPSCMIN